MDNNLKQLISILGLRKAQEPKENELRCLCPNHDDKNIGNFSINLTTGLAHCFACGYGDSVISMLYAKGLSYTEAKGLFNVVRMEDHSEFIIPEPLDEAIIQYYKNIGYCQKSLDRVKYDVGILEDYMIYCDGDDHPLIFVPNLRGEIISMVVKMNNIDITLISNNWKKLGCMFGLHLPNTSKNVLVEGVWDACHVRKQLGYKVVAGGGTGLTYNQLKNLEMMGKTYFMFDFDKQGRQARVEAYNNITKYKLDESQFHFCGSSKLKDVDPDELTKEQLEELIDTAKDYIEFGELIKEKK